MENVKSAADIEDQKVWDDKTDEEIGAALGRIQMEAKGLGDVLSQSIIEDVLKNAKLAHVKTGKFTKDNRNMIGAVMGVTLGVGLELLSPTGSKTSAITAGVVGGATLVILSPILKAAPQSTGIAATAGSLTSLVTMSAGRIAADYFPGNLDLND